MTTGQAIAALSIAATLAACGLTRDAVVSVGSDVTLEGGTWVLAEGTVNGRPLNVPDGHRITLTRAQGNQVGGTSACNGYGATVDIDGQRMQFHITGGTDMGCAAEVMAAEDAYLGAPPRVTTGSRQGETLHLSGPDVALTFELSKPVAIQELTSVIWELESLVEAGTTTPPEGEAATLLLHEDGTVTGSTGCRQLRGRYVVSGDQINFPDFAADGGCPPELQDQDSHIVSVLGDGFRAQLQADVLHVTSEGNIGLIYKTSN